MTARRRLVAWALVIPLAYVGACGSTTKDADEWGQLDGFEDRFPPVCPALSEVVQFVYENKTCDVDSDCEHAGACFSVREHCGGGFYLNTSYSSAQFDVLQAGAASCPLIAPCCGTLPVQPACVHGQCVGTPFAPNAVESCLQQVGDSSPCALCVCGEGPASTSGCATDPACAPIFRCARQAGCYGTLGCDLVAKAFPCRDEVNAAGGPKSAAATIYRESNAQAAWVGCDVACRK